MGAIHQPLRGPRPANFGVTARYEHPGTLQIRAKGGAQERVFFNPGLCAMLAAYLREGATEAKRGGNPALREETFGVPLIRSVSGQRSGGGRSN